MNTVRQFFGIFRNSPTYARDRINLISAMTIGGAALLLNGPILIALLVLMFSPGEFGGLVQRIEFGQLLGVVLLVGATSMATLLIPLRLTGVFMGPRVGRYFDQIVLTGISPVRFLMGKVTSQNLFLGLILTLLLPWFILVLTVGGLQWSVFLGNLILLWLYCMMLALVMLWMSLYVNEVLAFFALLFVASIVCGLGYAPIPYQMFAFSPFPALMRDAWLAMGLMQADLTRSYFSIFLSCFAGMSFISAVAFSGLCLGPLYGIIRDNSTFGEVVHAGDNKKKRRFRFRMHIQRPSELTFFYQNRSEAFRRWEGFIRWGISLGSLLLLMSVAWGVFSFALWMAYQRFAGQNSMSSYFKMEILTIAQTIHGISLAFAVIAFSHARNTTYLKIPVVFGRKLTVAAIDWICFLTILVLSTSLSIGIPVLFDSLFQVPIDSEDASYYGQRLIRFDSESVSIEGSLVIAISGITVYLLTRVLCLVTWVRAIAIFVSAMIFLFLFCIAPLATGMMLDNQSSAIDYPMIQPFAKDIALMSPMTVILMLFREIGGSFGYFHSTTPFYVVHGITIVVGLFFLARLGKPLRHESQIWQSKGGR